jgi:hypothetical protein
MPGRSGLECWPRGHSLVGWGIYNARCDIHVDPKPFWVIVGAGVIRFLFGLFLA